MCGISGVIGPNADRMPWQEDVHVALGRIAHRGPDGGGLSSIDLGWAGATIGQVRLKIVDQRKIAVPYEYSHLGVTLAYNGEIYNWGELRAELEDGTPWETSCDAEVLARAWRRWGHECLNKLNGMFAFALIDHERRSVFIARDRAGEKPLYWIVRNGCFYFASEIKGLAGGPLEETECLDMEVFEFDCREETPFKDVYALQPGHGFDLYCGGEVANPVPHRWWAPPRAIDDTMSWEEACAKTEALLVSAIRMRLSNEVPTTVYVSGGLDSAIIQAVAKRERVYCYDSNDLSGGPDRSASMARAAAGDADVRVVWIGRLEAEGALPRIVWHADTPVTWSMIAHWSLAHQAAFDGFKVVLTGEGADELFGGYSRYRILWWLDQMRHDRALRGYTPYIDYMTGSPRPGTTESEDAILVRMLDRSAEARGWDRAQEIVARFGRGEDATLVERMTRIDWNTTMQVLLRMADRATMAHGIENRSPFLDYRLIEHAFRMPERHKIDQHTSKRVLREVARRLGVPEPIVSDPDKRGLVVPWNAWRGIVGARGAYDRGHFYATMLSQWRDAWAWRGAKMHGTPAHSTRLTEQLAVEAVEDTERIRTRMFVADPEDLALAREETKRRLEEGASASVVCTNAEYAAMHPNGACTCAGEGLCAWCRSSTGIGG